MCQNRKINHFGVRLKLWKVIDAIQIKCGSLLAETPKGGCCISSGFDSLFASQRFNLFLFQLMWLPLIGLRLATGIILDWIWWSVKISFILRLHSYTYNPMFKVFGTTPFQFLGMIHIISTMKFFFACKLSGVLLSVAEYWNLWAFPSLLPRVWRLGSCMRIRVIWLYLFFSHSETDFVRLRLFSILRLLWVSTLSK